MTTPEPPVDRLLDTAPALRWQVERDLLGEPEQVWRATRARVATEGTCARLLAEQDADGQWAGGATSRRPVTGRPGSRDSRASRGRRPPGR